MINENFPANIHEAQERAGNEEKKFEHECKKADDKHHEELLERPPVERPVCPRRRRGFEDVDCECCGLINNAECETGCEYMWEVEGRDAGNIKCSECGSYQTESSLREGQKTESGIETHVIKYRCSQCGHEEKL
jgi:hypothetical protein